MREASSESHMIVAQSAQTPSLTTFGRGRPWLACLAVLSMRFSHSRRHAAHSRRHAAARRRELSELHTDSARTPPPCAHDAHLVGRSERCTDGARARPIHAPARAPSARRGRVSAHLESSPRRARIRAPSSRRDRLRPQSAPLRARNGRGRATSLFARRSRRGRRFPFVGFISAN